MATDIPSDGPGELGKNSVPYVLLRMFKDKMKIIEMYMLRPS